MFGRAFLPLALLACAPVAREDVRVPDAVVVERVGGEEVRVSAVPPPVHAPLVGPRQPVDPTRAGVLTIAVEEGTGIPLPPTPRTAFDTDAIQHALARLHPDECAVPGAPWGDGHVTMIFQQSGSVTRTTLDDGAYRGTTTGDCLVRMYEAVVVPPFAGPPVTVGNTLWLRPHE